MKGTCITISFMLTFLLGAQNNQSDIGFIGRYAKWPEGLATPSYNNQVTVNGTTYNQIVNNPAFIGGFWDKLFAISLYYDPSNLTGQYLEDAQSAVDDWNAISSRPFIALLESPLPFLEPFGSENPMFNTIYIDFEGDVFAPGARIAGLTKTYFTYGCDEDDQFTSIYNFTSTYHDFGSILVGGDIILNPNKEYAFGRGGDLESFSFYTVVLHELGHLLGLHHYKNQIRGNSVMFHTIKRGLSLYISDAETEAMRYLYEKEGLNAGNQNEFEVLYNCSEFDQIVKGLEAIDNGFNSNNHSGAFGGNVDPCNNCVQDVDEKGIDCGYNCVPCDVYCSTPSNYREFDIGDEISNATVVKDYIRAGDLTNVGGAILTPQSANEVLFKAGNYIDIEPGFETPALAETTLEIGSCQERSICNFPLPNVMTPNCDGKNDWLGFFINGATNYEVWIVGTCTNGLLNIKSDFNLIYHATGSVNGNYVRVWDGKLNNSDDCDDIYGSTFYYLIRFHNSETGQWKGDPKYEDADLNDLHKIDVFGENNHPCAGGLSTPAPSQKTQVLNGTAGSKGTVTLYPNPALSLVHIQSSKPIQQISIYDENTRLIDVIDGIDVIQNPIALDVSSYPAGAYTLIINHGEKIVTEKLIVQ